MCHFLQLKCTYISRRHSFTKDVYKLLSYMQQPTC
jgi:hypothetical protein